MKIQISDLVYNTEYANKETVLVNYVSSSYKYFLAVNCQDRKIVKQDLLRV